MLTDEQRQWYIDYNAKCVAALNEAWIRQFCKEPDLATRQRWLRMREEKHGVDKEFRQQIMKAWKAKHEH